MEFTVISLADAFASPQLPFAAGFELFSLLGALRANGGLPGNFSVDHVREIVRFRAWAFLDHGIPLAEKSTQRRTTLSEDGLIIPFVDFNLPDNFQRILRTIPHFVPTAW